jgi:transposase
MDLTDAQWEKLEPLIEPKKCKEGSRGRPPKPARAVLEGILWVMRTGAPWHDLPGRYPPYQTCHRRFQQWVEDGTLRRVLTALREDLRKRGRVNDIESFIDGTYVGAKEGDRVLDGVVPAMRRRSWRLQTALVFLSPLASEMVRDTTAPSSIRPSTKPSSTTSRRS